MKKIGENDGTKQKVRIDNVKRVISNYNKKYKKYEKELNSFGNKVNDIF